MLAKKQGFRKGCVFVFIQSVDGLAAASDKAFGCFMPIAKGCCMKGRVTQRFVWRVNRLRARIYQQYNRLCMPIYCRAMHRSSPAREIGRVEPLASPTKQ